MERKATLLIFVVFLLCLSWSFSAGDPDSAPVSKDELDLSYLRYKKGLGLIRLLYEKILSLDHHFSGLRSGQGIHDAVNPAYPDSNLLLLVSLQADLRLIAYETDFLSGANAQLLAECRELFSEYTKVIGYDLPLEICRQTDDWERVFTALASHIQSMRDKMENPAQEESSQLLRDHINLEFSVDRLLNFLRNYQFHIQQGVLYYRKFKMIFDNYSSCSHCHHGLPAQYEQWEAGVGRALQAYHRAFEVPELKGSQLKDLLYGFSD